MLRGLKSSKMHFGGVGEGESAVRALFPCALGKVILYITNIPILPIGKLDFCKQKLSAPPVVPMYLLKHG